MAGDRMMGGVAAEASLHGVRDASGTTARRIRALDVISRRPVETVGLAVPIVLVAALATPRAWTFDDGFIYFRTVDQILAGNGPVFNAGERIETFTSPLWLMFLTLGDVLSPMRLEYTAAALSIAATVAGMAFATAASRRLAPDGSLYIPIGSLIFAVLWPVWVWSTGGMEVGLTICWIGACALTMARWTSTTPSNEALPLPRRSLMLLGLGWLVRPELLVSSLLFVAAVVVCSRLSRRRVAQALAWSFVAPVAYQIFRMGYYGSVVSTPAVAKEGSRLRLDQSWGYVSDFITPYVLAIPVTAVALGVAVPMLQCHIRERRRRSAVVTIAICGSGLIHVMSVSVIGGDYVHARLLVPALFAVLVPYFVAPIDALRRRLEAAIVIGAWSLIALIAFRPSGGARQGLVVGAGYLGSALTHEDHGFPTRGESQPWNDGPGLYLASVIGNSAERLEVDPLGETVIAGYAIGALGYSMGTDVRVVDLLGLAEPIAAHERLPFRLVPGHEKVLSPVWAAARLADDPSTVLPGDLPFNTPFRTVPTGLEFLEQVAWASATLRCGPIAHLVEASEAELSVGTFLQNVRQSLFNTTLRIDDDPRQAYQANCGASVPDEVIEFYDRELQVTALPVTSSRGDIAIIGECDAVFVGTGEDADPWLLLETAGRVATIHLDRMDDTPDLAALWVLRPYGDWQAVVWLETDGNGMYRSRLDIDWFPPIYQPWTEIPEDGRVELSLTADSTAEEWVLTAGGVRVASAPVDGGDGRAAVPVQASRSNSTRMIETTHADILRSQICERMISIS